MDNIEIKAEDMEKGHFDAAGKAYIRTFANDYIASKGEARVRLLGGMLGALKLPSKDVVEAIESYRDDITGSLNDLIEAVKKHLEIGI
ncbi:MAG: hypothetical protein FWC15_06760 [Fibromonadales bacterium]|nr:hypothetical protein [Fibromonadales bacterium]